MRPAKLQRRDYPMFLCVLRLIQQYVIREAAKGLARHSNFRSTNEGQRDWKLCWSAFSSRCRTEFCVHLNQPSERVSLHLLHHFAPVRFYGNHADAEFVSDLFIQ